MSSPAAPRAPLAIGSTSWILTLASMTALVALSIDMSLPAQPTLARTFGVAEETAQLQLSLFMIGFAAAQLVVGYLSDAFGRRPVLLAGLALFTLAGIGCTVAPGVTVLIACRIAQGIGASAAPAIARAMVRDTQPAAQAARLLATMLATLAVAPMLAPTIGGLMLDAFGWRGIFGTLAVAGIVQLAIAHARVPETLPVERRAPPSLPGLVRNYREFFTTRGTLLPLAVTCTSFAGQFAYIADSPFVLMHGYHQSTRAFGVYFGTTALALMLGSLFGSRLLKAGRSPAAMLVLGTSLILAGGVTVFLGTRAFDVGLDLGIAGFYVPMLVYFFGVGISGPSAGALTLEPVPHIAGTGSAALGTLQMASGAIAGYYTTKIGGSDPRVFSLVAMIMAITAASLAWSTALARRAHPRTRLVTDEPSRSTPAS